MTWQNKTKEVLSTYYHDPNAVIVCMAMFQRFKTLEYASTRHDNTVMEVMTLLINDHLILHTNPFWLLHGSAVMAETGNRFFDYIRAHKLVQEGAVDAANARQNIQAANLMRSFLSISDLILRLHVPFPEYSKTTDELHKALTEIKEL